jgi:hypothetical protein
MDNSKTSAVTLDNGVDPFADPVGFLAEHGIEAELVEFIGSLPEAA